MQLFCFFIGEQEIGIPIEHVVETSSLDTFTLLPNSPKHVIGLVNLRGNIVPIISMAKFLKMKLIDRLNKVIYINKDDNTFGISISTLSKTVMVGDDGLQPYPKSIDNEVRNYYIGIAHIGQRNIQVMDVDSVITTLKLYSE